VVFDKDFLSEVSFVDGFKGSYLNEKNLFYSSLSSDFKNHRFVFFPRKMSKDLIFNVSSSADGFVVDLKTTYSSLVDRLVDLGYSSVDFIENTGDFALRGLVVDFFPFGYRFGVRVLFDGNAVSGIYKLNIKTQLSEQELTSFHLIKPVITNKLTCFDSIVSSVGLDRVFLEGNNISFFKKSPKTSYELGASLVSINDCLTLPGAVDLNLPLMTGFSFEGSVYFPSWAHDRSYSEDLSNDVYTDFSSLEKGDFVVHEDFGIGSYAGLSVFDESECLILSFQNTKINVFPPYFNKISFYKKRDSGVTEDTIGKGSSWARRVSAIKKQTLLIAKDIVESYITRNTSVSKACYIDREIEGDFLSGFPYKDTKDQGLVWKDIKNDLSSTKPMDRLVCGDVGFGKTELAIRAAFMCSVNGLSVSVLAPTTILAKQLFISFKERLGVFGINVVFMSRFSSQKEQEDAKHSFLSKPGTVLIGTHKIVFNEDILKKSSLMIVDDEHKFGVKQKESAKLLNPEINMLYMSATPIPRTLKLALSKITNISTLSTPPKLKIETNTYVDYFSKKTIQRAVLNEVERGGQVFFINNKVRTIPSMVRFLSSLFPDLNISFLHGQETPLSIETKMDLFISKKIDVLVASSIVESGVDIPSVNTIIINDAHLLGVSQLYQMRGRVGRSSKSSFAYLLIPKNINLSSVARARLKAIEKNSSLGSCYAVSLEDLDLRGGGSAFGYKQSGSAGKVGFELYNRFLEEAINTVSQKKAFICSVSMNASTHIPEKYISSPRLRVWLYKEVSSILSLSALFSFKKKTKNMFGKFPSSLDNLFFLKHLEILGGLCFFSKIEFKSGFFFVSPDPFFWKNKIDSLFNALIGFKFVLVDGGKVLKINASNKELKLLLGNVYDKIKN